jgi:hypothetical protein
VPGADERSDLVGGYGPLPGAVIEVIPALSVDVRILHEFLPSSVFRRVYLKRNTDYKRDEEGIKEKRP